MRTRIKDLRLEKKLSQQALAKNLSLNQSTLSKIECEIAVPDALLVSDLSRFFHVSTDYVFDGNASKPYVETDTPCPQSVYGSTKLDGERAVMEIMDRYYIIRTAWLYGDGTNFVKTMLRLAKEHDTITVVNDQFGSPTSAMELGRMILHIVDSGEYGIYHATCEGMTNWHDFAKAIFTLAKSNVNLIPVTTAEYPASVAKRPAYSVLENAKLNSQGAYRMKQWEDALEEYMAEMGFMG